MSSLLNRNLRKYRVFISLSAWLLSLCVVTFGCTHQPRTNEGAHRGGENGSVVESMPNDRLTFKVTPADAKTHRAVMRGHLEAIHEIVSALAQGNFSKAEDIAMTQLGFAKHREAMQQQNPEAFPPAYHDLTMAHHEAAEELAHAMPSHDLKQILPHLERTLRACVVCHLTYRH